MTFVPDMGNTIIVVLLALAPLAKRETAREHWDNESAALYERCE